MSNPSPSRPTWSEVDLRNLRFNFKSSKDFIGPGLKYMAVVKADGYGHGAVQCAAALQNAGADWFGVAIPEEGFELREAGVSLPILCLGGCWPNQVDLLLAHNLTPVVFRVEQAERLAEAARERGQTAAIHIKIDTGMGRIGVRFDEAGAFADKLKQFSDLRVEGLMTHFASADDLAETDFTRLQIDRFDACVQMFREKGFRPEFVDLANSPASVAYPESRGNMVRLGGILYGLGDDVLPRNIEKPRLKPVLSLHSRIAMLKDVPAGESLGYGRSFSTDRPSRIATVPIGYHDGYRRAFSNSARVIVNETFAPVVGRISMDWTIVDVTDVPNAAIGDEVVLIGEKGGLRVTAGDLAALAETISYEVTCGINKRVPRTYVSEEP